MFQQKTCHLMFSTTLFSRCLCIVPENTIFSILILQYRAEFFPLIFRHINGRVIVALACGQVAVFRRNQDGEWDLSRYHLVQLGLPHQAVRQLAVVGDKVWCGYRNKIHVLQPHDLKIVHTLEAHPRRESPVSF